MGSLSLFFPLSHLSAPPLSSLHFSFSQKIHLSISDPNILPSSLSPKSKQLRRNNTVVFSNQVSEQNGGEFLDENGAVDDMDGYLNYLSLEYDSVWDTKPAWCQPWTIMLTGLIVIGCSWLIAKSVAVTAFILILISLWWYIFLYSYPKEYSNMIAARRKKITDGVEDTFGLRKTQ